MTYLEINARVEEIVEESLRWFAIGGMGMEVGLSVQGYLHLLLTVASDGLVKADLTAPVVIECNSQSSCREGQILSWARLA